MYFPKFYELVKMLASDTACNFHSNTIILQSSCTFQLFTSLNDLHTIVTQKIGSKYNSILAWY